ncbi:MAG: cupin domain-containing protein [Castellaniella sp.]|uniref:cupin domain-containing protein n=1 Tax=Castellaniella sp. TaxID=1955812 RepID=UPI003A869C1A
MADRGNPGFSFTDSATAPWIDSRFAPGVQVKNLGKADGRGLQLVRFAPGATFPRHLHHGAEFIFLLEGEAFQNGTRLLPGWSSVAAPGTVDEDFRSETGCLFLFCSPL